MAPRRKRVRVEPVRFDPTVLKSKYKSGDFTEQEDLQLLNGLMMYGPLDLPKLCTVIPTRNETQIKQRMATLQRKAQSSLTTLTRTKNGRARVVAREKVALDKWLDVAETEHQKNLMSKPREPLPVHILSRALGYIAKYEKHPSASETGGVDFKVVYEFIESMMMGTPTKTLSAPNADFLLDSLSRLSMNMDTNDLSREMAFMLGVRPSWRKESSSARTYGRQSKPTETNDLSKFLALGRFNSFKVPAEWLEKEVQLSK